MDTLTLNRMQFEACHGVFAEEHCTPQPFEVTLTLELPLRAAGEVDALELTVDYAAVQRTVAAVMGARKQLIEALAERIAAEVLREFPAVRAVSVEVVKMRPPVDFAFAGVAARIRRERGETA